MSLKVNELCSQRPLEKLARITGFTKLDDTTTTVKPKLIFAPIVFYTPDTRLALGGVALNAFRINAKNDSVASTRMSYVKLVSYYTFNKQYDAFVSWNIFTPREDFLLKGELRFRRYPDRFYGIGNNSTITDEEKYEYDLLRFKSLFMKRITQNLFVGFDYEFELEYRFRYADEGNLVAGNIPGYKGGLGSAIGAVAVFDSRDNVLNSFSGTLAEISSYYFTPFLGSTFKFFELNGDYRKFIEIRPKHILAFHSSIRYMVGEAPFLDLSRLGGEEILRGYPSNRYIDKNLMVSQVEYRFPLFWRLGMTAFAGAGDVCNRFEDLSWSQMKLSAGLGLRLLVNPKERVNIRFDYAHGKEGGYFYFSVSEAF
jgi:hypothetical protein